MKNPKFRIGSMVKFYHKDNFMSKPTEYTIFDKIKYIKWDMVRKEFIYFIHYNEAEYRQDQLQHPTDYEIGTFY